MIQRNVNCHVCRSITFHQIFTNFIELFLSIERSSIRFTYSILFYSIKQTICECVLKNAFTQFTISRIVRLVQVRSTNKIKFEGTIASSKFQLNMKVLIVPSALLCQVNDYLVHCENRREINRVPTNRTRKIRCAEQFPSKITILRIPYHRIFHVHPTQSYSSYEVLSDYESSFDITHHSGGLDNHIIKTEISVGNLSENNIKSKEFTN